ncbi:MAG: hypothetical protein Ta2E_00440 [Mycoplasmoidaceae bacterium]|nr:MAG: hypothetical protein Ta2E_00440 [Mycoplasmoidaceae bacterium]
MSTEIESIQTVNRSDVIRIRSNETNIIKEAKIIDSYSANRGSIIKIMSYNSGNDTDDVKIEMSGSSTEYYDPLKSKEFRVDQPFWYSKLELIFFESISKKSNGLSWLFIQFRFKIIQKIFYSCWFFDKIISQSFNYFVARCSSTKLNNFCLNVLLLNAWYLSVWQYLQLSK